MKLYIPVASGVEASVKRQLKTLGYGDCPAEQGRISLEGDWTDVARLNVFLRAGERVLAETGRFPAASFDELFAGVYAIPWEEFLSPHARILMDGKSVKSTLGAVKAAGGVAKKAILKRLSEKLRVSSFDERGARAVVGISLYADVASVTLDTSGDGLHKRGYRVLSYDAPLRETTAAAILDYSFYRAERPFADVFCGSGTLPIEAAMLALGIAPGAKRGFDFTSFCGVPKDALSRAREEAAEARRQDAACEIFASDLSEKAISVARVHAERAGVAKHIVFSRADMRSFTAAARGGLLASNPPYGERLGKEDDLFALYRDFSRMFRRLPAWDCCFLSGYPQAERAFGSRADRRRTLWNSNLECSLYFYGAK